MKEKMAVSTKKEEKFSCKSFYSVLQTLKNGWNLRLNGQHVGLVGHEIVKEGSYTQCSKDRDGTLTISMEHRSSKTWDYSEIGGEGVIEQTAIHSKTKLKLTSQATPNFSFTEKMANIVDPEGAILEQRADYESERRFVPS